MALERGDGCREDLVGDRARGTRQIADALELGVQLVDCIARRRARESRQDQHRNVDVRALGSHRLARDVERLVGGLLGVEPVGFRFAHRASSAACRSGLYSSLMPNTSCPSTRRLVPSCSTSWSRILSASSPVAASPVSTPPVRSGSDSDCADTVTKYRPGPAARTLAHSLKFMCGL